MKKHKKPHPHVEQRPSALTRRVDPVLLLGILIAFVVVARKFDFVQDDAYITFRYIRNLIQGHGLVFNIGEKVEGYTTFLWTMLLAPPMWLGVDIVSFSRWLGLACSLGTLVLLLPISTLMNPAPRPLGMRLLAPLLLASCGAFAYWSVSGMETALFSLLVLVGTWSYFRERHKVGGFAWTPIVYIVMSLTRPEGMFLFGLMFLHRVVEIALGPKEQRVASSKRLALWSVWYAVPVVVFTLIRLWYYGYLFPNTYYAKAGISTEYLAAGWDYFLMYLQNYLFGGWLLAIPTAVLMWRRRTSETLYLIFLTLAYTAYIISVGGDVLHAHRFFLAIAPFIYLLAQESLVAIYELVQGPKMWAQLGVYGVTLFLAYATYKHPLAQLQDVAAKEAGLVEHMSELGKWINKNSPAGAVMAGSTIGAVSYYGQIPLIDMLGLTDATIAHNPERIEGIQSVWRERKYNVSYVLSRAPQWICFSTGFKPSAYAERALFTRSDFRRWYYPYYFHPTGDASFVDVLYRRAETPQPLRADTAGINNDFINLYYDGVNRVNRMPADALTYFRKAEPIAPPDFGMLHQMMAEAFGNLHLDAEEYRQDSIAVARDPRLMVSQLRLGERDYLSKNFAGARAHLLVVTTLHPGYAGGWTALGRLSLAEGDTVAARAAFLRALQTAPNTPGAAAQLQRLRG
jgi:arabinofuranosyltransferase